MSGRTYLQEHTQRKSGVQVIGGRDVLAENWLLRGRCMPVKGLAQPEERDKGSWEGGEGIQFAESIKDLAQTPSCLSDCSTEGEAQASQQQDPRKHRLK